MGANNGLLHCRPALLRQWLGELTHQDTKHRLQLPPEVMQMLVSDALVAHEAFAVLPGLPQLLNPRAAL